MKTPTSHFLLLAFSLLFLACQRDKNEFIRPQPQILPLSVPAVFVQEQGLPVELLFELRSSAGLRRLEVFRNGEPYANRDFTDELLVTYEFNYTVDQSLPDGTEVTFRLALTDRAGNQAQDFSFRVQAGPPFRIEDVSRFGKNLKRIRGRINRDTTLTADFEYLMDSTVSVEGNRTLTIGPGTTVYMRTYPESPVVSQLVITQGSRLVAEGTQENPIVFTSDRVLTNQAAPGDWGGVLFYGRAPTNQGQVVLEEGFRYGGTRPNDNSGRLRYVRNEYAGKNNVDAFQMLGVGAATTLDYLQVYRCADNAFRFKGGNANLKHFVGTDFWSYGVWAEHGWRGAGQFWVFQTDVAATIIPVNFKNQARSIELRNDANDFRLQPATYAYLSNITMIGNGNAAEDGTRRGMRIRRGAMGLVRNIIVTNFPDDGVRVEDVDPPRLTDATMLLANVRAFTNRRNWNQQALEYFLPQPQFDLSEQPVPGISARSFVGSVPSSFNPRSFPGVGSWFDPAPYIGAVENAANDWTAQGRWCRNQDGTIR
jgi:hypothetical protein